MSLCYREEEENVPCGDHKKQKHCRSTNTSYIIIIYGITILYPFNYTNFDFVPYTMKPATLIQLVLSYRLSPIKHFNEKI